MIQNPAIIALIVSSFITSCMLGYASWTGIQILENWNLNRSDERQLHLERKTYLISSTLNYSLFFQLLSFFLFIFTADKLHTQFTGAMCAAGTLAVNSYGYPVAILKITNCLLAGIWLIVNHIDIKGYDYPLIMPKYKILNLLAPMVILESIFQFVYFFNLKADVITSCCGSLFSTEKRSIAGEIAALEPSTMQWLFSIFMILELIVGIYAYTRHKAYKLFSTVSIFVLIISILSLISWISPYFYELPTHHCPFCILQSEYNYIGYVLYALLIGSGITGGGIGVLAFLRTAKSISNEITPFNRKLIKTTLILHTIFTSIIIQKVFTTSFHL